MDNNTPAPASAPAVDGIQAAPEAPQAAPVDPAVQNSPVDTEEEEWANARKEAFPDNKEDEDGEAEPKEPGEEDGEGEGEEEGKDEPQDEPQDTPWESDSSARDARRAAREYAQQIEATKSDIKEKMFSDVPERLVDADGDPINSVEDVMKRINPDTGETFEKIEAEVWLQSAQQQLARVQQDAEKRASEIAEVNVDLKDQADAINERYGAFLQEEKNHELRDRLWAQFEKTLERDKESGIITKMTVSLEEFYDLALSGRVEPPRVDGVQGPQPSAEEQAQAEAKAAAEAAEKKQKARADRSDIYAPNTAPIVDEDDKEWSDAAKGYYGERLNNK